MEYKRAVDVLKNLVLKHPLTTEEKEAVQTAIGVLVWGSLAKSATKTITVKRDKWGKRLG
jgi:hypothetical protein